MKDVSKIVIGLVISVFFLVGVISTINIMFFNKEKQEDVVLIEIRRIENKLDSLVLKKDSLRTIIDSTHVKIIENEKIHKERIDVIINNPDSINDSWAKQYIENYRQRFIK